MAIIKIIISFLICTLLSFNIMAATLTAQQFAEQWDNGNKFRIMRHQANILNKNSDLYSTDAIKVRYFETTETYEVEESVKTLEAKMAAVNIGMYGKYALLDIGALDVREVGSDVRSTNDDNTEEQTLNASKYSRVVLAGRYNELPFGGLTAGLIINETPVTDAENKLVFNESNTHANPFIVASLFGFQFMAVDSQADNVWVETSSFRYDWKPAYAEIQRSKIHQVGQEEYDARYSDEYIFIIGHENECGTGFRSTTADCHYLFSRNNTYNDQSQGWSLSVKHPYYQVRINSFDKKGDVRQSLLGGSAKVGFNIRDTTNGVGIKLMLGAQYNDGSEQVFDVADEWMLGFELEFTELFGEIMSKHSETNPM